MEREDIIKMAREAGFADGIAEFIGLSAFDKFAKLVAEKATEEANAKANASWTLMCEKMVASEREACAQVCEKSDRYRGDYFAAKIRERDSNELKSRF